MTNENYGNENDYNYGDEDEFEGFLDEDDDDLEDAGGALVPSNPYPKRPSFGEATEPERELVLV